jgi:cation diffusion facilitator family transporter
VEEGSKKAVVSALLSNMVITVFKLTAALISGSSSMLAEGYHSISDTFNQVLLLLGLRRCRRLPSQLHPFGYGKEQFFWSFVVAVILFGVAGVLSILEGFFKLRHPEPISHLLLNYLAIGFALFFETIALRIALVNLKAEMDIEGHQNWLQGLKQSKNPIILTVVFEDSLSLAGLLIAALSLTIVHFTGLLILDAIASILIGLLLMMFALFLANETRKLLVGEAVSPARRKRLLDLLQKYDEINSVVSLKTMHLSSDEVLIAAELNYRDDLVTHQIEEVNDRIETDILAIYPRAKVYLEVENEESGGNRHLN